MTLSQTIKQFINNPQNIPVNLIWRFPQHSSSQKHIFVLGSPRSGTTLAKLILGVHPHLNSCGYETGFFLSQDVTTLKLAGVTEAQRKEIFQQSQDIVQLFDGLVAQVLINQGGKRYVEKTPSHILRLDFLLKNFSQSQYIHVYRDGRDCYCSGKKHKNIPQAKTIQRFAHYWKKSIQARLKHGDHPQIFDLKYEDLVTNPEFQVKKMMNFLGETYDSRQIEPKYYSNNSITNSSRQEFSKLSQAIDSTNIYKYLERLTPEEIDIFNRIAGLELTSLGYKL